MMMATWNLGRKEGALEEESTGGLDKRLSYSFRSDQKWIPTSEILDSRDLFGKM
jgi:hypothetical protein